MIVGFDPHTGVPSLYQTDPSGTFSAWKANATGRNSNSMRDFLEKNYKETSGQEIVKLAIRALLEVVESGGKTIEVAVMTKEHGLRQLEEEEIDAIVAEIEAEKDAAEATNNAKKKDSAVEGSSSGGVTANQSERKPSNLSRRDGNQRPSKMDFEVPPTEHVPRVLPKDEDPSLVNRNKSMLGQLLGTLEREIYYITFFILKYAPLTTITTVSHFFKPTLIISLLSLNLFHPRFHPFFFIYIYIYFYYNLFPLSLPLLVRASPVFPLSYYYFFIFHQKKK
ncbi:unnamed protein product [Camellia sinensis]